MVQPWLRHLALVSEGSSRGDRQSDERRREQQHPVRDSLQGCSSVAPADSEHEGLRHTLSDWSHAAFGEHRGGCSKDDEGQDAEVALTT